MTVIADNRPGLSSNHIGDAAASSQHGTDPDQIVLMVYFYFGFITAGAEMGTDHAARINHRIFQYRM